MFPVRLSSGTGTASPTCGAGNPGLLAVHPAWIMSRTSTQCLQQNSWDIFLPAALKVLIRTAHPNHLGDCYLKHLQFKLHVYSSTRPMEFLLHVDTVPYSLYFQVQPNSWNFVGTPQMCAGKNNGNKQKKGNKTHSFGGGLQEVVPIIIQSEYSSFSWGVPV